MNHSNRKMSQELMAALNMLKENEEIDVLIYAKYKAVDFTVYLQTKMDEGELKFNFLEFANCYVVEASKHLLLEIENHVDVSKMEINPRFGTQ